MRKRVILLALVMALGLSACSILPEDSPIILEGEVIESVVRESICPDMPHYATFTLSDDSDRLLANSA